MKHPVSKYMTPNPRCINVDQSCRKAREIMKELNFRHLPVRSNGEIIGILSDRDINYAMAVEGRFDSELTIQDVYMPDPCCVSPDTSVSEVARLMAENTYGSVLIKEGSSLVGIFTATDACKVLAEQKLK